MHNTEATVENYTLNYARWKSCKTWVSIITFSERVRPTGQLRGISYNVALVICYSFIDVIIRIAVVIVNTKHKLINIEHLQNHRNNSDRV